MVKKVLILVTILVTALGALMVSQYFQKKFEEREGLKEQSMQRQTEIKKKEEAASKSIWARLAHVRSLEEWERVLTTEVPKLSKEEQKLVGAIASAKISEQRFWKAEHLLSRARSLLEQDENHPTAQEYLGEAKNIYNKLEEPIANMPEIPGDTLWNARLYFYKGIYYFRSLLFLNMKEEQSKAQDLIAQSLENLSKALEYLPKDRDIQVAIEILQKKGQAVLASRAEDAKMKLQLLPSRGKEINPFAIGGREEGKQ